MPISRDVMHEELTVGYHDHLQPHPSARLSATARAHSWRLLTDC